jgi:hypothetical protein
VHLTCGDCAVAAATNEHPLDHVLQFRGDVCAYGSDRGRRRCEHRVDDRECAGAVERRLTSHHLVRDHAKRPEIRPCIHRLAGRLLGRHVRGGAHRTAGSGELRCCLAGFHPRKPKIQYFDVSRRCQHQVGRFEIAVDDARAVRRVERVSHLREDAGDLADRHSTVGQAQRQGFALVVRHRDKRLASVVANLVHGRDVGVIERAGGARLPQQAGGGIGIMDRSRRQEFKRDPPLQVRILGQIHRAHTAGADVADDPVVRDGRADHGTYPRPPHRRSADHGDADDTSPMLPAPINETSFVEPSRVPACRDMLLPQLCFVP